MKKRLLSRMFIAVAVIASVNLFSFSASAFSGTGSGTYVDPYQITSVSQLLEVKNDLLSSYKLMADIDLTAWLTANSPTVGWVGIGWGTSAGQYFAGNFDGNGHAITGIWTNDTGYWRGLFAAVGGTVEIKNLGVVIASGKSIKSSQYVGGMVGYVSGGSLTISSCYVLGDVTATNTQVGAFIGWNNNATTILTNCYAASGTVTSAHDYAGGLIGLSMGSNCVTTITNCYVQDNVVASGGGAAGIFELALYSSGTGSGINITISNCVTLMQSITATGSASKIFVWNQGGTTTFTNNMGYDGTLVNNAVVSGSATDNNGLNQTSNQLSTQATYSTWDFDNVWTMGNGLYPFPVLKNMSMANQPGTRPSYLPAVVTGINSTSAPKTKVYYNVQSGSILVQGKSLEEAVTVYDYQGRLLLKSRESVLNISNFAKGIYLVNISGNTTKIVKE